MDYYQEGYDKGWADGRAGRDSNRWLHFLDFINTEEQQEYDNGYDAGYEAGREEYLKEGEEEE